MSQLLLNKVMNLSKAENLIARIEFLQQAMLDVATYSVDINEVDENYQNTYSELDIELEILQEIYPDIENPNPFSSLWNWYNFYSNQKEKTLAQRCSYVYEIYSNLSRKLHDMQFEAYLSKLSEPDKARFTDIEILKSINEKIETIKTIIKEVSTSGGNQTKDIIKENEGSYRNQYKVLDFEIGILAKLDSDIVNPNYFYSLWQWYSYWQSKLKGYSIRCEFVDNLYDDLARSIKKRIKKAELKGAQNSLSGENISFTEDRNDKFFSLERERQIINNFEVA
ncbi:MAG: hypothetical protein F6K42_29445 [Leptolyngbya sp. SIO1D8]|nr:hypothetical protein [Leptolyngbya sp. SIO1D8]